jgi:hypothetical protein
MKDITVLAIHDRIACFHSLLPFLFSRESRRFQFTDSPEYCLERDPNRVLVMVRRFIKPDLVDLELMKRLRGKYERIAFFHDDAGGGIPRLDVLPYVDLFYSKAIFRDRSLYGRPLYGKELYSNYFHERYGVTDPGHRERPTESRPAELAKLRVSWNIGVGDFPRAKLRQRAGVAASMAFGFRAAKSFYGRSRMPTDPVAANKGLYPVHARLGLGGPPSISYQRKLILERISGDPDFLVGPVPQSRFNHEVANSRVTLSPFGWGELCLRDFEAVRAGSLLLKPDMSHLETWPDVFVPFETYAPFDWEGRDVVKRARAFLDDEAARARVARRAYESYRDQLSGLEARFESVIAEITGKEL